MTQHHDTPPPQEPDVSLRFEVAPDAADDASPLTEADESETPADPAVDAQVEELRGELDEVKNRLLRVSADYQNYVRRVQQRELEIRDQQLRDMGKKILPAMDHFDRALSVDPQTATTQSVLEGVQIVREELIKVLEGLGIRRIDVKPGDAFDPVQHEAIARMPSPDIASQHIVQQVEPGYTLGEKTLRPAKVVVAA